MDAARREGFHETAYGLLERRFATLWKERNQLRAELAAAREQVLELEAQLGDWRVLAFKYGAETTAEKRVRTDTLNGSIVLARDLVMLDGDDAITHACINLAKKMQAAARGNP
jgi:hypothetical protein